MSEQHTPRVRVINRHTSDIGSASFVRSQRRAVVTIVSLAASQQDHDSDQDDIPRFMTVDLMADTAAELIDFLQDQNDLSSGTIVIIIEGWQSWLTPAFREAIPSFPASVLDEFVTNREIAMLPRFEGQREMSSVMEHVDVLPKSMISGRSRVVSRVDSDTLHPSSYEEDGRRRSYMYRNTATGAKNAPSGMLRHDV